MISSVLFRLSMILTIAAEYAVFAFYNDRLLWIYEQMKIPLPRLVMLSFDGAGFLLGINVFAALLSIFIGGIIFKDNSQKQMACIGIVVCVCTILNMLAIFSVHLPLLKGDRFLSAE